MSQRSTNRLAEPIEPSEKELRLMYDNMFVNHELAVAFLVQNGVVQTSRVCLSPSCKKIMNLIKTKNGYKDKYRCSNYKCETTKKILTPLGEGTGRAAVGKQLKFIFSFLTGINNYDLVDHCLVGRTTVIKYRLNILKVIKLIISEEQKNYKLGGPDKPVQVDETAFVRGRFITNPSELPDDKYSDILWLIGAIEEGTKECRLMFIPNRKEENFTLFLKENINEGIVIKTDGHRSYPGAIKEINCDHIIVNHSIGFKSLDGYTTNSIEGLWSQFKKNIKKRNGIDRSMLKDYYLGEFIFKYKYVRNDNILSKHKALIIILKGLYKTFD